MLVDFVDEKQFYDVNAVARFFGFKRDWVIRQIERGELEALEPPERRKRKRGYKTRRVQGAEILRFARKYTNPR
jgi:hypothetical protein